MSPHAHYSLEWKLTVNGKVVSKDSEQNLVLAPSDTPAPKKRRIDVGSADPDKTPRARQSTAIYHADCGSHTALPLPEKRLRSRKCAAVVPVKAAAVKPPAAGAQATAAASAAEKAGKAAAEKPAAEKLTAEKQAAGGANAAVAAMQVGAVKTSAGAEAAAAASVAEKAFPTEAFAAPAEKLAEQPTTVQAGKAAAQTPTEAVSAPADNPAGVNTDNPAGVNTDNPAGVNTGKLPAPTEKAADAVDKTSGKPAVNAQPPLLAVNDSIVSGAAVGPSVVWDGDQAPAVPSIGGDSNNPTPGTSARSSSSKAGASVGPDKNKAGVSRVFDNNNEAGTSAGSNNSTAAPSVGSDQNNKDADASIASAGDKTATAASVGSDAQATAVNDGDADMGDADDEAGVQDKDTRDAADLVDANDEVDIGPPPATWPTEAEDNTDIKSIISHRRDTTGEATSAWFLVSTTNPPGQRWSHESSLFNTDNDKVFAYWASQGGRGKVLGIDTFSPMAWIPHRIMAENKTKYRIQWLGCEEQSWQPKKDYRGVWYMDMVREWKEEKNNKNKGKNNKKKAPVQTKGGKGKNKAKN